MATGKKWGEHFGSMSLQDLCKLNRAVHDVIEMSPMMGNELYIMAIAPFLRDALVEKGRPCNKCWSQFLKEFEFDDLCMVDGTDEWYCPVCYEDKVADGLIDPQGDNIDKAANKTIDLLLEGE